MVIQSLSHEILFGTREEVRALVQAGADVNEKDVYGFTPLIEATLKEDTHIARFLLQHGARIDQQDISGQTALQWAVNREQRALCELFLEHQADPNHYSADGQPILVNPLLRGQKDLINKLVDFGADLQFAFDFVSAKLIGHRYELSGKARILNAKDKFIDLNYEGFYLEFTVGIILSTFVNFTQSAQVNDFKAYYTVFSKITKALKNTVGIIPYKYRKQNSEVDEENIENVFNSELVVVPVSYEGHAITFIKYGNFLAKCDRGVKHIVDTVVIYRVGNPHVLTLGFLKELMFGNKTTKYINHELKELLQLTPVATLPARYQLSGNCSWANVEASIPAMMFMLMFNGNEKSRGEIAALKKSIMKFYDTWIDWDKDRILQESILEFQKAGHKRRAAKASVLAAVLFQRCRSSHSRDVQRAKAILALLTQAEYKYLLRTYIRVYYTKMAGKVGEEFIRLLKQCGLNITNLKLGK